MAGHIWAPAAAAHVHQPHQALQQGRPGSLLVGDEGDLVVLRQAGPECPDPAAIALLLLGGPLLEPVRLQQPLLQEGVAIHGLPGVLAVLGLEGDQPPGPVLEGATQVAGQPQLLPVRHVPWHRGPDPVGVIVHEVQVREPRTHLGLPPGCATDARNAPIAARTWVSWPRNRWLPRSIVTSSAPGMRAAAVTT